MISLHYLLKQGIIVTIAKDAEKYSKKEDRAVNI